MRFPLDPLKPVGGAENPYEIREKAPVSPLQAVMPGAQQALVFQRRPRREPDMPLVERRADHERREREERRRQERRQANQKVLIDTRSASDRRHERRRTDDPTTGIDDTA